MIEPLGYYVLIEMDRAEERTAGGIILPQQAVEKEQYGMDRGTIRGVGPHSDAVSESDIGRKALFGRYAGLMFDDGGVQYRLIDNREIRGVC
jgi:chaperonin GroES